MASRAAVTGPALPLDNNTAAGTAPSVGLSSGHKPPSARPHPRWTDRTIPIRFFLRYSPDSLLVETRAEFGPLATPQPWRRSTVKGLTKKSRARCIKTLATVPWDNLAIRPIFLTLTYPATWPGEWQVWKAHFDAFWKRVKRGWRYESEPGKWVDVAYPEAACIWRLELQERGAPHYHLILFNVRWLDIPWLDQAWAGVVRSDDPDHARAGTRVEWPRKWKGTVNYVAKYVAKQAAAPARRGWSVDMEGGAAPVVEAIGRHWGVAGRKHLPQSLEALEVDEETFEGIKSVLIELRDDPAGEELRRAPFRGLWGTCGPGPIRPILAGAGLIDPGQYLN